jgi:hypothetical protein
MVFSDEQIREFQEIYKEHFGIEISKEEAYKNGLKLLQLIRILYTPVEEKVQSKVEKILPKINR